MLFRSNPFLLGCAVLLFASIPLNLAAQSIATPVRVNDGPTGTTETSPCMHIAPDGTIYVSWFADYVNIYFARSMDGGRTFTKSVKASSAIATNMYDAMFQRVPKFAVDTKGVIHLVWLEERVNNQGDIWYIRSTDRGATWTSPVSIMDPDDSSKYAQDFPSIAIDSSDNIYVSFLDSRDAARKTATNMQLLLTKSTDGGKTWSNHIRASRMPQGVGGTCECCKEEIVASPEGHLYIAFRSNINNVRDIYVARSWDRGETWDTAIKVQSGDWTLAACPVTGPSASLDKNENLHVTWRDARDGVGRNIAYYSLLRKGDTSVFPNWPISRRTNQSANWPDAEITDAGLLFDSYEVDDNGTGQLRYTYSLDGGNSWSIDTTVSIVDADQELANVEQDRAGNFYLAWMDGRNDGGDIYFTTVSQLPSVRLPGTVTILSARARKSGDATPIKWAPPIGMSRFVWYDVRLTGNATSDSSISLRDTTWIPPALANGTYQLSITAHTLAGSSIVHDSLIVGAAGVSLANSSDPGLTLFPDPVEVGTSDLNFVASEPGPIEICIYDMLGRSVSRATLVSPNSHSLLRVAISALRPGLYRAVVSGDRLRASAPFVIR